MHQYHSTSFPWELKNGHNFVAFRINSSTRFIILWLEIVFSFPVSNKMEIILVTRISTLYFLFNPCLREQSKTKRILNYSGLAESWWCIKTLAVIFKSKWTKATIHHKNIMINAFNSALTVWTEFFFLLPMEKGFDINQTAVLTIGPHLNSEYWAYSKSKSNSL